MPRPLGDMPLYNDINMNYMTSDERGVRWGFRAEGNGKQTAASYAI